MRRAPLALGAAVLASGLALAGCGGPSAGKPDVKVTDAFIPAPASGDMAAGFFIVHNSGAADTLTSVSSTVAGDVTMHSTKNGVMREQESFAVPADGDLDFERGGNHLMFENLKQKPKEGDRVTVRLHFAGSGTVEVAFPVKAATYNPSTSSSSSFSSSHASHSSQ
ncbi:copper chaperone PCu(A)C [Streptomyces sp. NPDC088785]|uniref:copper chaperone PCu(A)C n=1 Tax=Streptomyces sp. NPDC088785 TaxID=3365897 RepID=UPI0037FB6CE2